MATFADDARIFGRIASAVPGASEHTCNAMAEAFQRGVKSELARFPHPAHTRTPSPPGEPPGLISGRLRESVTKTPATSGPVSVSHVGPHRVYAVIQEYGGPMHAHRLGGYMTWVTDGRRYYRKAIWLPERPYMRPVARRLSATGQLSEVALRAFGAAIYEVEV